MYDLIKNGPDFKTISYNDTEIFDKNYKSSRLGNFCRTSYYIILLVYFKKDTIRPIQTYTNLENFIQRYTHILRIKYPVSSLGNF